MVPECHRGRAGGGPPIACGVSGIGASGQFAGPGKAAGTSADGICGEAAKHARSEAQTVLAPSGTFREVGDIARFRTDGDFASYRRLADAKRLSNGKCKGDNNQKCGNKYLAWTFV